uniref:CRAL-TRIO domain-containing protein n=1 Tax=viral metagenome TaxID=1070528 RepID=A0A6C0JG12_9ZZZZ
MENEFMKKMNTLTNQYYADNKKNTFFKTRQKNECANTVLQNVGIETLIPNTIYHIPNTNRIFLDYNVFKLYATPDNYDTVVEYILAVFNKCITENGNFEAHIDLNSFTLSAAERYKTIITLFINKCMITNSGYSKNIGKMCIYNTTSTFQGIAKFLMPLIDPTVKSKISIYDKSVSPEFISQIKN